MLIRSGYNQGFGFPIAGPAPLASSGIISLSAQLFALQKATLTRVKAAAAAALISNPVDNVDMASPPTITQSGTHDATLTVQANPSDNPTLFRNSPGDRYILVANHSLYMGTSNFGDTTATNLSFSAPFTPAFQTADEQSCYTADFVATGQVVELELRVPAAGVPYRFIVDGQFVARDGLQITSSFVKLTFGSSATRTITVECQTAGATLRGVSVGAGGSIAAVSGTPVKMLALGDSITEGSSSGDATFYVYDRWSGTAAKKLGFLVRNAGVGQTGYSNNSVHAKLKDELPFLWTSGDQYDVVSIAHGFNDYNHLSDFALTMTTDALAAWQAIRANQPQALIAVLGIWGEATGPAANLITAENNLLTQFNAWNDPCSVFIPISTDSGGAWLTGTGYVGATNGSGNSDTYVSADGVHQSRAGGIYTGGKLNTALRAKLPALYTAFGVP